MLLSDYQTQKFKDKGYIVIKGMFGTDIMSHI